MLDIVNQTLAHPAHQRRGWVYSCMPQGTVRGPGRAGVSLVWHRSAKTGSLEIDAIPDSACRLSHFGRL